MIATKTLSLLEAAKERVLFYDGAMGTNLFAYNLTVEDYGGEQFEGCPEYLNVTKPEIIQEIHSKFLEAGADIIQTNTFGSSRLVLGEYGISERAYELSKLATELAREVADKHSTEDKPRFVAGSIGPGTKLPSLGHISYDELVKSYKDQIKGIIDGGADIILIETCQDPLQIKATLDTCFTVFQEICSENEKLSDQELLEKYPRAVFVEEKDRRHGLIPRIRFPISTRVTVETMGTLLVGSEVSAALTSIAAYPIDVVGLNCATGPKEMVEHIKYLCDNAPCMVSCLPNAGIPENIGGRPHYPLSSEEFADYLHKFVDDYGVNIVGGCCGTNYDHIGTLVKKIGTRKSKDRKTYKPGLSSSPKHPLNLDASHAYNSVSSLYQSVPMLMEPKPLIVGERTNANGSKAFREMLGAEDFEGITELAKGQVTEGAHVLDVCAAYVGRDETKDMKEIIYRLNTAINIPIMVDSTEYPVIEESLKLIAGKALVNSVNLEDGEQRVADIAKLCNKYGASLVVLTIDEDGMAKTAKKKLEVAKRLYDLLVKKHGMRAQDLIFDTLTFTLGSGEEDLRSAGIETIEAIRMIKEEFPEVKTILGVSNISFGLDAKLRAPLNSIFMFEAIKAGLDMAIVNNKKIIPLGKMDEKLRKCCEDLIYDKRTYNADKEVDYDPLISLLACAGDIKEQASAKSNPYEGLEVEEILEKRIIDGNKLHIEKDLDIALSKGYKPFDIINKFLMNGMKTVGELFGAGEMQLPFVLQSATAMKAAVSYLENFMDKSDASNKGTLVLATVKGDVHDIGKNLVDIILSNNGYKVINLGIKQTIEELLKAVDEHKPDALGMSGLLVKSTQIMKDNLEIMNERKHTLPVILGGAALTKRFVENDCRETYNGKVLYGIDAFTSLKQMDKIVAGEIDDLIAESSTQGRDTVANLEEEVYQDLDASTRAKDSRKDTYEFQEKSQVKILSNNELPQAPFYGDKLVKDIDLDEVWKFLNIDALFIGQWRFSKGRGSQESYEKKLHEEIYPALERTKESARQEKWLQPQMIYGYYPCKVSKDHANTIDLYDHKTNQVIQTFKFPRQTSKDKLCLADYFQRNDDDYNLVPFQIVTVGDCATKYVQKLYEDNDFSNYLYANGLAVETTEALAEYCHSTIRKELGYAAEDHPEIKKLIKGGYHGLRYSFGYPACPKLEDQAQLFELLKPERLGIRLSEEWQMHPEQSTSAIVIHHPDAKYYNV